MEAIWDCASQLWVPINVTCAWASVSRFLPHISATLQFQVLMSMQMEAYLKKEQIGTLFVRVGAPEGFFWGGGSGGATPKIGHDVQIVLLTPPDLDHIFLRPYDTVFYCTVPYIRSENENTANRHITGRNAFVSVHHAVCTQARNEKIQSLNSNASLCEEHNLII